MLPAVGRCWGKPTSTVGVFENSNLGVGALCYWSAPTVLTVALGSPAAGVALLSPSATVANSSVCPVAVPVSTLVLRAGVVVAVSGGLASTPRQCVTVQTLPIPHPLSFPCLPLNSLEVVWIWHWMRPTPLI